MKNLVAIIPARGGSKRFPGKNVHPLCGRPLIGYPIEAALKASGISRVIVSTDSEDIAEIARSMGAEVPFMRPDYLSNDNSSVVDTVIHAAQWLESAEGFRTDYTFLLQPTTPIISQCHIEAAINMVMSEDDVDSVIAVTKLDTPSNPYNIRVEKTGGILGFWQEKEHYETKKREYGTFYKAANMWVSSYKTLLSKGKLEGNRNRYIEVAWEYAFDIDHPHDLELIEAWLERNNNRI